MEVNSLLRNLSLGVLLLHPRGEHALYSLYVIDHATSRSSSRLVRHQTMVGCGRPDHRPGRPRSSLLARRTTAGTRRPRSSLLARRTTAGTPRPDDHVRIMYLRMSFLP